MTEFDQFTRSPKALALAVALFACGAFYLVLRSYISPVVEVDFRFFWLAGTLWGEGVNPYSESFREMGALLLPDGNKVLYWFYPPQWWIISRPLSLLGFEQALSLWRILNGLMIMGGVALLVRSLAEGDSREKLTLFLAMSGAAMLVEPTANLLAFGQSAGLVFLGLAAFCAGCLSQTKWLVFLGIFLTTFKPQIGALLLLVAFIVPQLRFAAMTALGVAGLLCLPQLSQFGVLPTIAGFLANLSAWGDLPSNTVEASSGPLNLLSRMTGVRLSLNYQLVAAFLFAAYSAMLLRRDTDAPALPLLILTSSLVALLPLHIYDFTILIIPVILLLSVNKASLAFVCVIIIAIVRPGKIEKYFDIVQYSSNVSLGLIFLNIAALALLCVAMREYFVRRSRIAEAGNAPSETLS